MYTPSSTSEIAFTVNASFFIVRLVLGTCTCTCTCYRHLYVYIAYAHKQLAHEVHTMPIAMACQHHLWSLPPAAFCFAEPALRKARARAVVFVSCVALKRLYWGGAPSCLHLRGGSGPCLLPRSVCKASPSQGRLRGFFPSEFL